MTDFNVILFDGFETLDAFGPVEVIGRLPENYSLKYFSLNGGVVESSQHIKVSTLSFSKINSAGILLIPGGMGTRDLVNDKNFIEQIKALVEKSQWVLTVCTGSVLLAKTGLLNGLKATSNKQAFAWAMQNAAKVNWVKKARWVNDGKFYTSSGVSAGIDMALGFVSDVHGSEAAKTITRDIEYIWNSNKDNDPFAIL